MRIAKKYCMACIALLPLLVLFAYVIGNIGSDGAFTLIEMGEVQITQSQGGYLVSCTPDSWGDLLISPLYGSEARSGLFGSVAGLCHYLDVNAGIPANVPTVLAIFMLCYLAAIELLDIVTDLLLFVPRKCMEIFR